MWTKIFGVSAILTLALSLAVESAIVSISKPFDSNDSVSRPFTENVWTVSAPPFPLNTNEGIGYIINSHVQINSNPSPVLTDATLHDHAYLSPYIPHPVRAQVTYVFDNPTIVSELEVIQHLHGVTQIEGFIGNTPESLFSIGRVYSADGDFTTASGKRVFSEGEMSVFRFTNNQPARIFRFVVRKTNLDNGYAAYRAFPRDEATQRIPPALEPLFEVTIKVGEIDVCWSSKTNNFYQVEYYSSATTNIWTALGSARPGTGSIDCISDSVRGQPQRFYRVRKLP